MQVGKIVRSVIPYGALAGIPCRTAILIDKKSEGTLPEEEFYPAPVQTPETLYFWGASLPPDFGDFLDGLISRNPYARIVVRTEECPYAAWMARVAWLTFMVEEHCLGIPCKERILTVGEDDLREGAVLPPTVPGVERQYVWPAGIPSSVEARGLLNLLRENPDWVLLPQSSLEAYR